MGLEKQGRKGQRWIHRESDQEGKSEYEKLEPCEFFCNATIGELEGIGQPREGRTSGQTLTNSGACSV